MATHDIQTVMEPWKTITVGDDEYAQLLRLGLVYSGSPVAPVADGTDLLFADKIVHGVATPAALKAAYVPALLTTGSFTYNADGTIASDPDGNTYTYNADGTLHTITKGGVTRTLAYDANLNLTGVS